MLRPRRGEGPLPTDRPFIAGLFLSSTARAYLENIRASRARGGTVARTLPRRQIEECLDTLIRTLIRRSGEDAAKLLRDEVRALAPAFDLKDEADGLDALIGTREAELTAPTALARRKGRPYDPGPARAVPDVAYGAP
ncbi:MAG: filamentation induced by cAMP protein Fic [Xanthobacteraceae bacterium]|nr:MAG: filamentation induced by cAMP protein Fic [Xanthobacteraceae bacterium]